MSKLYFEANLFSEEISFDSPFVVVQNELVFDKIVDPSTRKMSFTPIKVEYTCEFVKSENFDNNKPTLIIPIRDNIELLEYTLNNLREQDITESANILVVDDRSKQNIEKLSKESQHSYLRVDNEKGFNFSMLNNIAAKICHCLGVSTIVLWNSDLWCPNKQNFLELLNRHKNDKSKMSGSKLIYPPEEMSLHETIDTPNIVKYFPSLLGGRWRETVQFGGETWIMNQQAPVQFQPAHYRRFGSFDDKLVDCDRGSLFLTGALQVFELQFFIDIGGLNPSLSKNYQDADITLKAYEHGACPMYYGKDIFFYHDESYTFESFEDEQKIDEQFVSDQMLFGKIWNEKIPSLLGLVAGV